MTNVRIGRLLMAGSLGLALAGCSLAPTYERPAAPVPQQYPNANAQAAGDTVASLPPWRDVFHDARLQALITLALANNRDLRIAVQRTEEARAQFGIARSDRLPSIGLQGTGQVSRQPESLRSPGSDSVSRVYTAGVGLAAFELDFFGRVRNLSEAAYQQYLATEQARRTVQLGLVATTAQAYFNLREAEALQRLADKTLAAREGTLRLVRAQFDAGVASDIDLAQAQGQLDAVRADRVAIERSLALARNALRLVLGTDVPDDLPAGQAFGRDQLLATLPVGLPSQLLERRPDVVGAEHALMAANAQIGAARAAFFPRISLTGLLGFASPDLDALFGGSHRMWQFQPQIQTPLFAGGGLRSNLDLAEALKNEAVANYEKTIQTAFREVADGLAGEATYQRQLDAVRATEDSALKTLDLAQVRYKTGVDSFLQVQTAEVNLYSVQQQFIELGTAALLNRVALYKALGGGWSASDAVSDDDTQAGAQVEAPANASTDEQAGAAS